MRNNIKKYYQVFVSSTYLDLREHRQTVMQTLLKANCLPIGMELFPNGKPDVWDVIKGLIKECDLYIVITGDRYGTISETGKSFTEMEYDFALENGKEILVYPYIGQGRLNPKEREEDDNHKYLFSEFKKKIFHGTANPWKELTELKANLSIDLVGKLQELEGGWTRQPYGAYDFLAEEMQALESKFDSDHVKSLINMLRSTINQFQFSHSKDRILQLGDVIPFLSEREWKILNDFARAQVRVRTHSQSVEFFSEPLDAAMQKSIVDIVAHYENQLRNFEQGVLEVEGELIEKVSSYFVSAVQDHFLALSSDDFDFWNRDDSKEYYQNNLELVAKGVSVKRIFIVPNGKLKYKDVQNVLRRQIRDGIKVSIITSEAVGPLIKSVWDRDFAIHDHFAVSFFRNYYSRIYKIDSRKSEINRYIDLHKKIEINSQAIPDKSGKNARVFEVESEFDLWISRLG